MERLEDSIVASLREFSSQDPRSRDCMFVFPLTPALTAASVWPGIDTETDGHVLMVCRTRDESPAA